MPFLRHRTTISGLLLISIVGFLSATGSRAAIPQVRNFPVTLDSDRIRFGSPTLADINGDGRLDIIVGSSDGVVHALTSTGQPLWRFRTDDAFNAAGVAKRSATTIRSTPAVTDLNGDGKPEIVVGVGEITEKNQNGGVVVLRNDGTLFPGWPQLTVDHQGPDGYNDGVVSSPAIGDLTGDGIPEIAYGSFDHRVWVKRINGENLPNWPQFVHDTVWSSPAIADLNRDGRNEIIIGVDAHLDPFFGHQDGGYVKVFRTDGSELPGWPQYQDDIVFSSPAVADLDGDGSLEVVVGAGGYYATLFGEPRGRYITAYRANGTVLWRVNTGGVVGNSPAIGDLNGDKVLDVAVGVENGHVMAISGKDGRKLWDVKASDTGVNSPVLGDYDGDGLDDIIVTQGWEAVPFKGTNGQRLAPTYTFDTNHTVNGVAALGDLDKDGKLELVLASGNRDDRGEAGRAQVFVWRLANSTTKASWPMYRGDAAHSARVGPPTTVTPSNYKLFLPSVRR